MRWTPLCCDTSGAIAAVGGSVQMDGRTMDALPEIAVSAVDQTAADTFVADLIGTDGESEATADTTRVWHLLTKYYRARVRVRVVPDAAPVEGAVGTTEAHVVYLTESECACGAALERRVADGAWQEAEVRVAACDASEGGVAEGLWAAARAHQYQLVPLRAPADRDEPLDEPWGLTAVRDALYAHLWPNLQRFDQHHVENGVEGADELSWSDGEEAGGVEDMERAVGEAAAVRAHSLQATAGDEAAWRAARGERLRRAEHLLAAFTRALR